MAWDGKSIAADRLAVDNGGHKRDCSKLFRLPKGKVFAGCGNWSDVVAMLKLVSKRTMQPMDPEADAYGFLWDTSAKVMHTVDTTMTMMRVLEPFHAIGSGREYAIAAMACGRSAADAVKIASRFDAYTGSDVDVIALRGK